MDGRNPMSELGNDPDRPVRIFCDGVYDLFHYGHAKQLEQVKKMFKYVWLIVGVHGDEEVKKYKGLVVMTGEERAEGVRHCKWVDEIIFPSPWIITMDFVEKHKIDFVAHDEEIYPSGDCDDIYGEVKRAGKFLPTQRTPGISSSEIITRIIANPDAYILQNIAKGAADRKELRISWPRMIYMIIKSLCVKEVKVIEEETSLIQEEIEKQAKDVQTKAKETAQEIQFKAQEFQEKAMEKANNMKEKAKKKAKEFHEKAIDLQHKAQEKAHEFQHKIQSEAKEFQTKMENRFKSD